DRIHGRSAERSKIFNAISRREKPPRQGFKARECIMRWSSRRDGTIAVYDDVYPNDNLLVVEPIVTTFTPMHGNGRWLAISGHGVEQVIHAPLRAHSQKPDEIAERIERLVGDVPRIELFARTRRPGGSAWRNEVDKFPNGGGV